MAVLVLIFLSTVSLSLSADIKDVELNFLDFQVNFLERKLLKECHGRLKILPTDNIEEFKKVRELVDNWPGDNAIISKETQIGLGKATLEMLKEEYLLCNQKTTTPPTTTTTTAPTTTTTTRPPTTTRATTQPPTTAKVIASTLPPVKYKGRLVYTENVKHNGSAFEVLRSVTYSFTTDIRRTYLMLEVRLPKDGLSASDTWCHDYTNLCRHYNRLPIGCPQSTYGDKKKEDCHVTYYVDQAVNIGCPTQSTLTAMAENVFPNVVFGVNLDEEVAISFFDCLGNCHKDASKSGQAMKSLDTTLNHSFMDNGRVGYIACH